MNKSYYEDELQHLRTVAPEFARANPAIARLLANPGSDPDVERLLEGVAFLCGQVREKLDDELPEFTGSLMSLLWPHYLRPIPSITILELLPDLEAMQAPRLVPKVTSVFAAKPKDGTSCRFRACWDTLVRPLSLTDVRLEDAGAKPLELVLGLRGTTKVQLDGMQLDTLRLHLSSPRNPAVAYALHHLLVGQLESIRIRSGNGPDNRPEVTLSSNHVSAAGIDSGEAVLPYSDLSFAGFRLLQEYFACRERFLFVDIRGIDRAVGKLKLTDSVELRLTFRRRPSAPIAVGSDNIRLHCVPIINLFDHPAEPIRLEHDRVQYLVLPAQSGLADRRHAEVYSVDRVRGLIRADGFESRDFRPFFDFSHATEAGSSASTFFQTRVVPNVRAGDIRLGTDTYVSFVVGGKPEHLPAEETISVDLTCTNRHLPARLVAGDICEPTDQSPPGLQFRNLYNPSPTVAPPLGKAIHWRLISHMSLNYVSVLNAQRFKSLLHVYDFQSEHDAQRAQEFRRLLDGIVTLRSQYDERVIRGATARGIRVDLELNEECFVGEGDAFLFATLLDRFFCLYATLNAYSQTNLKLTKSRQDFVFAPRWGEQITPGERRDDVAFRS